MFVRQNKSLLRTLARGIYAPTRTIKNHLGLKLRTYISARYAFCVHSAMRWVELAIRRSVLNWLLTHADAGRQAGTPGAKEHEFVPRPPPPRPVPASHAPGFQPGVARRKGLHTKIFKRNRGIKLEIFKMF